MISLSDKMLEKITERFMSCHPPYTIIDFRDTKMMKEFAARYGISRLSAALPDCIRVNMTKRKSHSGNRIMKITTEHYIVVPDSQKKIAGSSGSARKKGPYITKKTAGETDEVPLYLPVITNRKYRDAMGFNCNSSAYLQMLSDGCRLAYKNGASAMKGFPATYEKLKEYRTGEGIEKVHIPLLMALYGILLQKFMPSPETHSLNETAVVYYPDLAKKTGKTNTGVKDIASVTNAMEKLENIAGIVNGGQKGSDILPVLSGYKYDDDTNTIRFSSPYMARIIQEIHKASIQRGKNSGAVKNENGDEKTLPAYSYLVDISIEKERNKKAVEIVMIIVALVEQAGKNTPHIRAKTIIERSSLLKKSLQNSSTQKKDTVLRRSFSKAWELLRSNTRLSSVYKDIELPDPDNPKYIPTSSTIEMVFRFPHKGKKQDT